MCRAPKRHVHSDSECTAIKQNLSVEAYTLIPIKECCLVASQWESMCRCANSVKNTVVPCFQIVFG
eukprot:2555692-Pyramimonas_sp.AAC.1